MVMGCSENDADKMCTRAEIEVCYNAILTQWVEGEGGMGLEYLKGKKLYGPLQLHRIYPALQKSQ